MSERETWLQRNIVPVIVVLLFTLIVVLPVLWQFLIVPTVYTNNADAGQDIADDSIDSEKALNDYREFRTLWYEIEAQHEQTQNYERELDEFYELHGKEPSEWSDHAETTHSRLKKQITASRNQESNLIADYNAMSADATTSLYQCYLPNRVDKKLFISDGTGVDYKVDDPPANAPKAENLTGDECKFSQDPEKARQD